METLRAGPTEEGDACNAVVLTLNGVPIVIGVDSPQNYRSALREARFIARQVENGDMHWSDGIVHLSMRAQYYEAKQQVSKERVEATDATFWHLSPLLPSSLWQRCLQFVRPGLARSPVATIFAQDRQPL